MCKPISNLVNTKGNFNWCQIIANIFDKFNLPTNVPNMHLANEGTECKQLLEFQNHLFLRKVLISIQRLFVFSSIMKNRHQWEFETVI